jgi:hypothetical protein
MAEKTEAQKIREWARLNGHQVGERGRISETVRAAYAAANGGQATNGNEAA